MFGNAARLVTMTHSMPALQESSNHQEPVEQQKKTGKKVGHWAKTGKFKVTAKKPGEPNSEDKSARRDNEAGPKPKKKTPYKLHVKELKTEGSKLAIRKMLNWKKATKTMRENN